MNRFLVPVAALSLAILSACPVSERTENEGTPPPGDLFIQVIVTDDEIRIPSTAPAGTVSFEVENNGADDHGFAIEGPGVSEQLEDDLDATETGVLTVELEAGTYTVYSPTDDQREHGLEATIEIIEADTTDRQDGDQPGVGPSDQQDAIEDEGP